MAGVRIKVSSHGARPFQKFFTAGADTILKKTSPGVEYREILQTSFMQSASENYNRPPTITGTDNGLVRALIGAYNLHRHLTLRPEDIWFAILSQLSAYINKHAEELRGMFVSHSGKKELVVKAVGTRYTVNFGDLASQMSGKIQEHVVDAELRDWILPDFSTTTQSDIVVASILMMFTLLGDKADYEKILSRLDKLESFGPEAAEFATLLKPVVSYFARSFDHPEGSEVVSFWQRVLHVNNQMSGPTLYSGWITAFIFWNEKGDRIKHKTALSGDDAPLILEGAKYPQVDSKDVPPGWGKVPVRLIDNDEEFKTEMLAGSVAISSMRSDEEHAAQFAYQHDSVQPTTGWFMYEIP